MAAEEDSAVGLLTHFFNRILQAGPVAGGVARAWWTE
jgi:hypothetical protein